MAFSAILIGHDSLTREAGRMVIEAGHTLAAIVTRNPAVAAWAQEAGLTVTAPGADLDARLPEADWLLSVANLDILSAGVLAKGLKGAVNFHDGPLPAYAGLNAPVWAILQGETSHGISWHLIEGGVDEGRILEQRLFEIAADDTALSLNGKCFAAALESFPDVIGQLAHGLRPVAQDLSRRSYFARDRRPAHGGRLDYTRPTRKIMDLVRALDHGDYPNPLTTAKILAGGRLYAVTAATPAEGAGAPGTVLAVLPGEVTVATGDGALRLTGLRTMAGQPARIVAKPGEILPGPDGTEESALTAALKDEGLWRRALTSAAPAALPALGGKLGAAALTQDFALPDAATADQALATFAAMIAEGEAEAVDFALARPGAGLLADRVPVRFAPDKDFAAALAAARARAIPPADLALRLGRPAPDLAIAVSDDTGAGLLPGAALTFAAHNGAARLTACPDRVSPAAFALLAARLAHRLAGGAGLSPADQALIAAANATAVDVPATTIHAQFAAQAAKTPDAVALVVEDSQTSYTDLDAQANRIAHRLIAMGVTPGQPVGLMLRRGAALVAGALGILKAGGAYVPLDPGYPADRLALYVEDSGATVIVTEAALFADLPPHQARVLVLDTDSALLDAPASAPETAVTPADLAYLIYTSGSTGRPKGVMIEHRHVVNFFAGMDARVPGSDGGAWLAVTSLSFDISVLELFWTLTRGFRVVVASDSDRAMVAGGRIAPAGGMEFSLYYWGNDDGVGRDKYGLLLEGARFADDNGFVAVWTPERHFHAFGGPYPNPSVTGAAVAGMTRNIGVRAGSCVAPLHHPARIAEEWAVIDNLTNGRAGLAIASGWQPDDFVLRPENTPPNNKKAMLDSISQLRRLWAGEAVEFPTAKGEMFPVVTQPRPVSKELPVWVTTAGNPDTWREAGKIGANVLTHLLGQSVAEVAEKIGIYHAALREAGHDPRAFKVTLMLHTYLAETRDQAREIAREPMKDYLRSAAGLIKQYAWAFPAFKKPKGVDNPMQIDLGSLTPEELDGILDFAFLRYFDDSGLFGTVDDALARVDELKRIGVSEVACLIDYGIAKDTVLAGLRPLAEVLRRANQDVAPAEDDFSLAAQIIRHGVTHLQSTPSMARMFVTNDDSRAALARVKHLLIGGEALPGALVADLQAASPATITNMYGPTETTIWSTTATADAAEAIGPVGTPIANTQVHVLDAEMRPVAPGVAGDLWIGGDGVARGYWRREDLTADRFRPDPFRAGGRLYNTGDLARWRADGALDFLGRADHQVKIRGYRIELGEIESALDALPGIRQAVVIPREDVPGVLQLVAYALAETLDETAVKAALAEVLPPQMIPARVVRLDAFPLTPNRKVDRKALPAPTVAPRAAALVAPAPAPVAAVPAANVDLTEVSTAVAHIWSRLLGVEGIGPRDSFFDLGGHSLLAVQAHRDIRDGLGARALSITDIFRFPTLAALSARVAEVMAPVARVAPPRPVAPAQTAAAPAVATPEPANAGPADPRAEAMARRRELRARRGG